jgi:phosphatidylinositol glycan class K
MIDTCQANTMFSQFYSPDIIATGSSAKGENSLSHHADDQIGVSVIDSYTHFTLNYLEGFNKSSKATVKDFVRRPTNACADPVSSTVTILFKSYPMPASPQV